MGLQRELGALPWLQALSSFYLCLFFFFLTIAQVGVLQSSRAKDVGISDPSSNPYTPGWVTRRKGPQVVAPFFCPKLDKWGSFIWLQIIPPGCSPHMMLVREHRAETLVNLARERNPVQL